MISQGTGSLWGEEGFHESGYKWLGWTGQDTIYPQGTTAHFIFEANAPPGSNVMAMTYLGTGIWENYTWRVFQGNGTSQANLIFNGSFEFGTYPGSTLWVGVGDNRITGWSVTAGNVDYIAEIYAASDGLRCLDMAGLVPGAISTSFATTIGAPYKITFDLAGNFHAGAPGPMRLEVSAAGTTQIYDSNRFNDWSWTNMGWTTQTFLFTANSDTTTLEFKGVLVPEANDAYGDPNYYVGHGPMLDNVKASLVSPPAAPPVANAGGNQTVHAGAIVTLNGSGTDPGGNLPLTYAWKFNAMPDGSNAALDDPTSKAPKFLADKYNAGNWVLELVVTNSLGTKSAPAIVTISTSNSAPVAEAGPDQLVRAIGTQVQLDGTQSYDENGDLITYQWTLLSVPEGSTATLVNPTFVNPTFTPDIMGDYVVALVVNDPWVASAADKVTISFRNVKPVANAGTNQSVVIGVPLVTLNGSASSDADGDPLTYTWGLTDKPAASAAILTKPTAVKPTFTPDVPGNYTVQLIVNDGFENSAAATVTIHVAASRSWVTDKLRDVIDDIGNKDLLPDSSLKNKNMRNTMITKLNVIIKDVDAGNYAAALAKLQEDVMAKTNGCAESVPPVPDNNDWIVICTYQSIIYPELQEIAGYLTELAK